MVVVLLGVLFVVITIPVVVKFFVGWDEAIAVA